MKQHRKNITHEDEEYSTRIMHLYNFVNYFHDTFVLCIRHSGHFSAVFALQSNI